MKGTITYWDVPFFIREGSDVFLKGATTIWRPWIFLQRCCQRIRLKKMNPSDFFLHKGADKNLRGGAGATSFPGLFSLFPRLSKFKKKGNSPGNKVGRGGGGT